MLVLSVRTFFMLLNDGCPGIDFSYRCVCYADADYRGNVGVILFNHADEDFEGEQSLCRNCSRSHSPLTLIVRRC